MIRRVWLDCRGPDELTEREWLLQTATRLGFDAALVRSGETLSGERLQVVPEDAPYLSFVALSRGEGLDPSHVALEQTPYIIAVMEVLEVAALENLIALTRQQRSHLIVQVRDRQDIDLAIEALQEGADGFLLPQLQEEVLHSLVQHIHRDLLVHLQTALVSAVRPVYAGERACIDLLTRMTPGEGMLIGSKAAGLFLVHSETQALGNPLRPFRVNAGSVAAYILLADGRTKYLNEIEHGDTVVVASADGTIRFATVDRTKIEIRPLFLVEARLVDAEYHVYLQHDMLSMLVAPNGVAKSILELEPGDSVLMHHGTIGRHYGMAVAQTTVER